MFLVHYIQLGSPNLFFKRNEAWSEMDRCDALPLTLWSWQRWPAFSAGWSPRVHRTPPPAWLHASLCSPGDRGEGAHLSKRYCAGVCSHALKTLIGVLSSLFSSAQGFGRFRGRQWWWLMSLFYAHSTYFLPLYSFSRFKKYGFTSDELNFSFSHFKSVLTG